MEVLETFRLLYSLLRREREKNVISNSKNKKRREKTNTGILHTNRQKKGKSARFLGLGQSVGLWWVGVANGRPFRLARQWKARNVTNTSPIHANTKCGNQFQRKESIFKSSNRTWFVFSLINKFLGLPLPVKLLLGSGYSITSGNKSWAGGGTGCGAGSSTGR
jgi:hypothetical protein